MDRRSAERCPKCQGPGLADPTAPDGVRCRRSTCVHNHQAVRCPRCQAQDLESVHFEHNRFEYVCRDCTNKWQV